MVEPAPVIKTEEEVCEETPTTPVPEPGSTGSAGTSGGVGGGSSGGLRVKTTELRRSSSSPQVKIESRV